MNPKLITKKSCLSDNHLSSEHLHRGKLHIDLYCNLFSSKTNETPKQQTSRKCIIPEVWKEKKRDGGGGQTHEEI